MRRVAVAVLIVAVVLAVVAPPAQACGECVALGVVSFLAFAGTGAAATAPPVVYAAPGWSYPGAYVPVASYPPAYSYVGYYPPRYYYSAAYPAAHVAAPPAVWTGPRVVQYAHGRHELRGDGVSAPWVWVWIPNGPPAPRVPTNPDGPEGSGAARTR